jgi:hypothetical protein
MIEEAPAARRPTASAIGHGSRGPVLDAATPLEWTFNPWRERPAKSALALTLTLGSGALLGGLGLPGLARVVLGLAVGFSFASLLLPVRCRLDERGVGQCGPLGWEHRRWEDIRRAVAVRGGLLVSPFGHARGLDRFRALLLPIPREHRSALGDRIAVLLARHGLGTPP